MDEGNPTEQDNATSASPNQEETLRRLERLEKKLNILQDINKQLEQLRESRKMLLESITDSNKKSPIFDPKLYERRVSFAGDLKENTLRKYSKRQSSRRSSNDMAQKSQSMQDLLFNLHTWMGEFNRMKSEIELLETRKQITIEPEEILIHEEKIKHLETKKDELNENLLHFFLEHVAEGKEQHKELIKQLEDENRKMEDKMLILNEQIHFLKENNKALMLENEYLRRGKITKSLENLEKEYRKSFLAQRYSTFLPESKIVEIPFERKLSWSAQLICNEENEDTLSLDRESVDSFNLDKQLAYWKMDDESITNNLKRLEYECQEMEVVHMKLNFLKRYVRKHGVNYINKNTLIDPSKQGLQLWDTFS